MATHAFTLELETPPRQPMFELVDGETDVQLFIALQQYHLPYDLNDRTVKAIYTKPNGESYTQQDGITCAEAGVVEFILPGAHCMPGVMQCDLQVWSKPEEEPISEGEEVEEEEGGEPTQEEEEPAEPPESATPALLASFPFAFLCRRASITKRFAISLDSKRSTSNREFEVVDGDNGNVLGITLTDDGQPVKLTYCYVMAVFSKPNGTTAQQDSGGNGITIHGPNGNELEIELGLHSFSPGLVECELLVFSGEEKDTLITSARFNFYCRRGIANTTTVAETGEWPFFVSLMKTVEAAEAARQRSEEIRHANEADRAARCAASALWAAYDERRAYEPLNKVCYEGASYICIQPCTGIAPGNTANWLLIAERGADGMDGEDGVDGHDGQDGRDGRDGFGAILQYPHTLYAAAWVGGEQLLEDIAIAPGSHGSLLLAQSATAAQYESYAALRPQVTRQENGAITVTARGILPEADIPVVLEVWV